MNRLQATPVTVPVVCWLDRGDDALGTPYYVMEQVPTVGSPGEFPPYHAAGLYFDASPEERATMWWGCVRAIADVHALDWRELKLDRLLMPDRGSDPLEQVVDYYSDALRWASAGRPRAELAAAVEWLRDNIYRARASLSVLGGQPAVQHLVRSEVRGQCGSGLGNRLYRRSRGGSGLATVHRLGAVGVSGSAAAGWHPWTRRNHRPLRTADRHASA